MDAVKNQRWRDRLVGAVIVIGIAMPIFALLQWWAPKPALTATGSTVTYALPPPAPSGLNAQYWDLVVKNASPKQLTFVRLLLPGATVGEVRGRKALPTLPQSPAEFDLGSLQPGERVIVRAWGDTFRSLSEATLVHSEGLGSISVVAAPRPIFDFESSVVSLTSHPFFMALSIILMCGAIGVTFKVLYDAIRTKP